MNTYILDYHDTEFNIIREDLYSLFKSDTFDDNHGLNLQEKNEDMDILENILMLDNKIVYISEEAITLNNQDMKRLKQDIHYTKEIYLFKIYHDNFEIKIRTFQENFKGSLFQVIAYITGLS